MNTCKICGSSEKIVRDHDHKTGYIRGLLCQQCNGYLGVYEKFLDEKWKMKKRHYEWLKKYKSQIEAHLASSTGEIYRRKRPWIKVILKGSE